MAHYDLEEQEQIANLKTWWSMYGNLVCAVVIIVSLGVISWQAWNWYQNQNAVQANSLFSNINNAFELHDENSHAHAQNNDEKNQNNVAVVRIAGELEDNFANSGYASLAAFMASKISADKNDFKTAKLHLAWVMENSADEMLIPIAKLRLANILLDEKNYDEALKVLAKSTSSDEYFFASLYDLQGDIYLAKQDIKNARKFWQMAKTEIDTRDYKNYGVENYMPFMLGAIENKLNSYVE